MRMLPNRRRLSPSGQSATGRTLLLVALGLLALTPRCFAIQMRLAANASVSANSDDDHRDDQGRSTSLVVRGSRSSPSVRLSNSYVRFDLSSLPAGTTGANVARATLRLWINKVD